MARYFLGCMHEQYHPRDLLEQAVAGEQAGFDGIACSDHFQPWWEPGHSGQAWVWLGAAAQATERIPVGPAVTVALKRYHPALVAQGFATLEAMYPGRVFVGLGSGESLNESPFGLDWPPPRDQPAAVETGFSSAPTDDEALAAAKVWKGAVPEEFYTDDWFDPQAMYERGEEQVPDDDFRRRFIVSSDPGEHVARIKELEQLVEGDVVV